MIFKNKKLLLAGVGQLNRRVAERFVSLGGEVIGFRRSEPDLELGFEQFAIDLAETQWPDVQPDFVVVALSAGSRELEAYQRTYVKTLEQLAKSLPGWQKAPERVLVVSSSRVYGVDDGEVLTDDSEAMTNDPFGEVLLNAEALCHVLPIQTCALRLSGIYGPGRDWLKRQAMKTDPQIPMHDKWTNRIHIDDAAAAIIHSLQTADLPSHCIVSDTEPMRQSDMFNYFRKLENHPPVSVLNEPLVGKQLHPTWLTRSGFEWQYPSAFSGGYEA